MEKLYQLKQYVEYLNVLFKKEKEIIENAFGGELLEVSNFSYEEIYQLFKNIKEEVESLERGI